MQQDNKVYKTIKDLYESFPSRDKIDWNTFRLVLKVFNHLLVDSMVREGKVYYLPPKLGVMGVFKEPVKGRGVFDYQLYKDEGIKVWKKNLHSSSYTARFIWKMKFPRTDLSVVHRRLFKWEPTRYWKRRLAKEIKEMNSINKYYDKDEY